MAVMKASRGVTIPRRPHSEAMVSSAFKMFSVAVSSVLEKEKERRGKRRKREQEIKHCLFTPQIAGPPTAKGAVCERGEKWAYLASSSRDRAASRPHQQALTISSHTRWAPNIKTQNIHLVTEQ